jgi:hypothetical protein
LYYLFFAFAPNTDCQALLPLGIEPGIPRVRPWKELIATGAQATLLLFVLSSGMELKYFEFRQVGSYLILGSNLFSWNALF